MEISDLKRFANRAARLAGLEIHSFRPERSDAARILATLRHFKIDLILDVGANEGQFAESLFTSGYDGRIVSFEPLRAPHERLSRRASKHSGWQAFERCAVGAEDSEATVNIAGNSASSSLLPMLQAHLDAAPDSRYIGTEAVPLRRLDTLIPSILRQERNILLKIDTQGYEGKVLDGAGELLSGTRAVQLELSFVPLYENQPLWDELRQRMTAAGFSLWLLMPGIVDPTNGRLLQADGIFVKMPSH